MIVIADTTPIISLLKIKKLDILENLFGNVFIPMAVFDELVTNSAFSEEANILKSAKFIKMETVLDEKSVSLLRRATGLDLGESEAIILAEERKSDLLLMDEIKGRAVAKQMGIHIMGLIGILLAAFENKLLTKVEIVRCIEILRNSRRHINEKLYQDLLEKLE